MEDLFESTTVARNPGVRGYQLALLHRLVLTRPAVSRLPTPGLRCRHSLLYAAAAASLLLASPFRVGVVHGSSMEPSLHDRGLYILVQKRVGPLPLKRGDVVVFSLGGETYIKRVLAVAGDTIHVVRQKGQGDVDLLRKGAAGFTRRQLPRWSGLRREVRRVPAGHYFVVGDDLRESEDSRHFGPVPDGALAGKILFPPRGAPELADLAVDRAG